MIGRVRNAFPRQNRPAADVGGAARSSARPGRRAVVKSGANREAMRLRSLHLRQQWSVQSLSAANRSSRHILSLFGV
jgi:hypothetical protein